MLLKAALEDWLIAAEAEGRRPATLISYRTHTELVRRALATQGVETLEEITAFHIRKWMVDYQKGHSPHSVRSLYVVLRAFLNWCLREKLLKASPMANIKPPKPSETFKDVRSKCGQN